MNIKVSQSTSNVEPEKSKTLDSLIFKNQFNHRGMIRKPKLEGKPEVVFHNKGSQCFERCTQMVSNYKRGTNEESKRYSSKGRID
jgi:hypothetical protein